MNRKLSNMAFLRHSLLVLITAGITLVVCGCQRAEQDHCSRSNLDPGPVATIGTALAESGVVVETLETFGTVEFDPHDTQTVSFVKSGLVVKVFVTPGQSIDRDDPLLTLGPMPSSSMEVRQARINLEFAERNLDRFLRLMRKHLATNDAVQQAEKEVASAKASLRGLGIDGFQRESRIIRAPFSGVVAKVLVTSGGIVHPGEDALVMAPQEGLAVRVGFEPEDAARLRHGMQVSISPVFSPDGETLSFAVLANLHHLVDPRTQLVEALIRPSKIPSWMLVGTKVRVDVVVRSAPETIRIPRGSLLNIQGEAGVFVVENGVAYWRPVHLGIESEHWVEVRNGLRAGSIVVTTGRTSLRDGMSVTIDAGPGA